MREPGSDRQIISTTDARQGVTGENVNNVLIVSPFSVGLIVSLLFAAIAGVVLVGYFWYSPWLGG